LVSQGRREVSVAIVDSGVSFRHPELAASFRLNSKEWPLDGADNDGNGFIDDALGWDFLRKRSFPDDPNGHGTFIAGLIAGALGNGVGAAGLCPRCSLIPVRFSNREGSGTTRDAIQAIDYASAHGASVINYSFAGQGSDAGLKAALERAGERDVLVVVPAGNTPQDVDRSKTYPARYSMENLITVTATDEKDQIAPGVGWGQKTVHLAAPGVKLISTWNDDTIWKKGKGTSYAAPLVAAAAGLVKSVAPHLKASQIREILMATARPVPALEGKVASGGVLDAGAAVRCASRASLPCLDRVRASRAIQE
jgi:subtilisin family serine protease